MYWILFIMGALVSVVLALVVGGLATPRKHVVSRAITLNAAPPAVWKIIHDVAEYPTWRNDIENIEVIPSSDGVLRWRETGGHNSVGYEATASVEPTQFRARITDVDLPYSGEWEYRLSPSGKGTKLVITERGDVSNPIFRFIGRYIIGQTGTIDRYLRGLAKHLGESAQPVPDSST